MGRPRDRRASARKAELVVQFHGLLMDGGFLGAFGNLPAEIGRVVRAYESLRLDDAAATIDTAVEEIGAQRQADPRFVARLIDSLDEATAASLDRADSQFERTITDERIGEHIERYVPRLRPVGPIPDTVPELVVEFRATVKEWNRLHSASQIAAGNREARRASELQGRLASTEEGRLALWALRTDPDDHVRSFALIQVDQWKPDEALPLIDEIAGGQGPAAWSAHTYLRFARERRLQGSDRTDSTA